MYRIFSLQEANALLPEVDSAIDALQARAAELAELRRRHGAAPDASLEARALAAEIGFLLAEIADLKRHLDGLGVHLQSVERGTVDIPARVGGEVVCFVHAKGDDAITHYHRLTEDPALYPLADPAISAATSEPRNGEGVDA